MTSISFPAWPDRVVVDEPAFVSVAKDLNRRAAHRCFVLMSATLSRDPDVTNDMRVHLGSRYGGIYSSLPQHSPLPDVLQAARAAHAVNADALVSVGGGSIIDATKAVQQCLAHGLFDEAAVEKWRARPAECRLPDSRQPIHHICVPTTLSGAEFTHFAGVRNPATGLKETFVDLRLMPRTLIFDQFLCRKTPEQLWLSSGVRALDHAIEGLCSDRLHAFGKLLALQGISQLCETLAATKANPSDLDARKRSQFGAWFASIPLMSGVTMGASHAIGHAIGSLLNVPHGLTSCVILPAVMQFNYAVVPEQLEEIAAALGHADGRDAPDALRELIGSLGLPTKLSQIGIGSEIFPSIVRGSLGEGWLKTNPRPIRSADDIHEILTTAA